jgi:hypothetical protein
MAFSGARQDRFRVIGRSLLLAAGLCTYLFSRDDLIWHLIKNSPRARSLEHGVFATAAAILGLSLLLELRADSLAAGVGQQALASFLRSVGIGCLLPLSGFLLLVIGDLAISLLLPHIQPANSRGGPVSRPVAPSKPRWSAVLIKHIGLSCAFISMLVFSIVLSDRVADVLFALTAVISVGAELSSWRRTS